MAAEERDRDQSIENVTGGAGNDRLKGSGGPNVLAAGAGADLIDGGLGSDVLRGGLGTDTLSYAGRSTAVAVTLNGLADDGADPDKDGVSTAAEERDRDVAIESATGGAGNDRLKAQVAAINVLTGGGGNDKLDTTDGSPSPDHMDCGAGASDAAAGDPSDAKAGCES